MNEKLLVIMEMAIPVRLTEPLDVLRRTLREMECSTESVLPLPLAFRDRTALFCNILPRFFQSSSSWETHGMTNDLRVAFLSLAEALCYLSNSTSFQTGTFEKFDREEIARKLKWLRR